MGHRRGPAADSRRRWVPYLIVVLISTFVVSRWFRAGTFVSTGDMGPFIRRGWAPELAWSWNHSVTGAGSAAYNVARAFELGLIRACQTVGLDEYAAQWLFYTVICALPTVGTAYLAGGFVRRGPAIVVAGAFGLVNGFFLTRLPNPLNIISVGSVALLTGLAVRVAKGRRIPALVAGFALLPTSFLGFNPPMLVVVYAWALAGIPLLVVLIFGRRALGRLLWWMLRAGPWAVLLNLWWLVPLVGGFTGGGGALFNTQLSDPTAWAWAQAQNTVPNVVTMVANWAWVYPQYLPFAADLDRPWWVWIRFLLPALAVLAPVVALPRRRRAGLVLLGTATVVVFLAKGLQPPLSEVNLWLYLHAPGFWLFREPMSKLGQLLVPCYGVLIAMLAEGVLERSRAPLPLARLATLARPATAAALALVIVYPYPLITGAVIPDIRPGQPSAHVRVPDFWRQAAETIDADPRPGKVLVLPLDDYYQMPTTWGFFGVDSIANLLIRHPVVQRRPDGYFGDSAGFAANVQAVETALMAGDLAAVRPLLDALQVSTVVLRHDLVRGLPGRTFVDDRTESVALARVPGLHRTTVGALELWRVGAGTSPTVRGYDRLVEASGQPAEVASLVGSLVDSLVGSGASRTAVAALPPLPTEPGSTAPAVTADTVTWQLPAVEAGTPSTAVRLPAGRYLIAQRARAAAVLRPSMDLARHALVLHDPARLSIDGRVVSSRPDLVIPVGDTAVTAVRVGTRMVSLDGWGRPALPHPPGQPASPASVTVGSATPVVAYAPSRRPAEVSPLSEVYDCNSYQPRPAAELGLRSTVRSTAAGPLVTLSARDHAACVRTVVKRARPGRTYRIRLEYRQVTGNPPQVCVWQLGLEGCELTPRAAPGTGWTSYERVVTLEPGARGLEVVLHADVGLRFAPATVAQYRGLAVEGLDPVARTTAWPPAVPARQVSLAGGTHRLTVTGGAAGSVLAPFEPLQDCFRYDELTPAQAGLVAQDTGGPDPVLALGARSHMACVGAGAPDFGNSSLYRLSLQARSAELRNPKFCVYLRGPDRCMTLPTAGPWQGWTSYQAMVSPDPEAVETRLYLYGLPDPDGLHPSRVEYRRIRLVPVAAPSTVVLVREQAARPPVASPPGWRRQDPAHYRATTGRTAPAVVALAEAYAPGWTAHGAGRHLAVNGWMNAWRLPAATTTTMSYAPARVARYALYVSPVAALAALAWLVAGYRWRARRRPPAGPLR
jgi:arabinofuranan 3-O-arabinosyltransferase